VRQPGLLIDEAVDSVILDGRTVAGTVTAESGYLYVLLNKPSGYLVTAADSRGRPTVYDLLRDIPRRVFPVGRLDLDTEGVLLLTDDGDLAHRLMHPRHEAVKGYRALVTGKVRQADLTRMVGGLSLEDGTARARRALLESTTSVNSRLYIELITGKKRQVKRMCAAIGHPVRKLRRVSFAGLTVHNVPIGEWRYLTVEEITRLSNTSEKMSAKMSQKTSGKTSDLKTR